MGYSHHSSSSTSLPLFLTCAMCLSIVLVTQNKRRMRRRGRWQPTKRFLPVLVFNWIFGLFLGNRDADFCSQKPLTRSSSYSRQHST
ncbi:hypothetical protein QTG54_003544 [Skeletonema marinoi]|uniref:Uncharacterized protein n=1 Tax=Skeletonema marinoi TaxID=267567 RepID=A0AAD9DH40_9STRA|nr:hypothetical protein QTG54_003544 [Skeletonema marinoi]